jgi:hypothetical protein
MEAAFEASRWSVGGPDGGCSPGLRAARTPWTCARWTSARLASVVGPVISMQLNDCPQAKRRPVRMPAPACAVSHGRSRRASASCLRGGRGGGKGQWACPVCLTVSVNRAASKDGEQPTNYYKVDRRHVQCAAGSSTSNGCRGLINVGYTHKTGAWDPWVGLWQGQSLAAANCFSMLRVLALFRG